MPGVDLWTPSSILGVLRGLWHVAAQMPESDFRAGYRAALEAAALGLSAAAPSEPRQVVVVTTLDDHDLGK